MYILSRTEISWCLTDAVNCQTVSRCTYFHVQKSPDVCQMPLIVRQSLGVHTFTYRNLLVSVASGWIFINTELRCTEPWAWKLKHTVVNNSMNYFVGLCQCKTSPLYHFHGDSDNHYIVNTCIDTNRNRKRRIFYVSITKPHKVSQSVFLLLLYFYFYFHPRLIFSNYIPEFLIVISKLTNFPCANSSILYSISVVVSQIETDMAC